MNDKHRPHVVIIGAGFGGLEAARSLRRAPVRITVVDKHNHHLFQPLLYQVATASLSESDISAPIRWILKGQKNATVMMDEVLDIEPENNLIHLQDRKISYDYLIVATGMTHFYFDHSEWAQKAPGLKSLSDATEIRRRILLAFETAEKCKSAEHKPSITTFVVVGGGPTGVELAGAIAELAKVSLRSEYHHIDTSKTKVILAEAGPRLLPTMEEALSKKAKLSLEKLGVEVRLSSPLTEIEDSYARIGDEKIATRTVIWAAGVSSSPLGRTLGVPLDKLGRVKINEDLTIPGYNDVFVIGDMAYLEKSDGKPVPGMSPAAMQQGRHAARNIKKSLLNKKMSPFVYVDKGTMATIGKASAVVEVGLFKFSGFFAWTTWLAIHIFFLIGFRNRLMVLFQWAWAYLTSQRHGRVVTHPWRQWKPGLPDNQIQKLPGCNCRLEGLSCKTEQNEPGKRDQ